MKKKLISVLCFILFIVNAHSLMWNEDKDDVYISCNVFDEDYGDMMCIIPCKFNKETNKYEPAENDINYISNDDGDEVYPEYIPNSEMISAIPEDILEDLSLL